MLNISNIPIELITYKINHVNIKYCNNNTMISAYLITFRLIHKYHTIE